MGEPEREHVACDDAAQWRAWLAEHHARAEGVWLVTWKRASGRPHLAYEDAVCEALCFGWVDSKPGKVDAERTKLWFAPRQAGSGWARTNQRRVAELTAAGRMHPAGQAKVDAAKADGSWSRLDAAQDLEVPPDLQAALAAWPHAAEHFQAFPPSARRGILEWIIQAKTAATRSKRIAETAELAARNERANQWPRKRP